ncbi:hypothetical protein HYC85_013950 [Camellia sinensis]|uniref:C3H1-type domain-containing protein n=1 Tax=Camellia sinensis TaxID=4442 RepID=A0A7J7H4V2_CAMSI|nr:hypothetical protein HYC85_013950 [Camellia sinensis]
MFHQNPRKTLTNRTSFRHPCKIRKLEYCTWKSNHRDNSLIWQLFNPKQNMPPKQQSKADLAKKQKLVEDKTFGLKNKNKSKNVQKYVQSLQQNVQPKPDPSKLAAKKKKEEEKAREKELNDLFKIAVVQPKVPVGVDPKSIVCEFYKVGQCVKGFKCKFSHDLNVQRKGEKIDIYSDKRD